MSTHLYRSRHDRMLAGVAGGLAELWDADPSLVRLVWALLVIFTGGIALVVYIVMALVVPEEEDVRPWGAAPGWEPPATPGAVPAPGVEATSPDAASIAAGSSPEASPAGSGAGASTTSAPATRPTPMSYAEARWQARESRRRERQAWRATRREDRGRSAPLVVGTLLVLIGAWFLVREYIPSIDWDWFWPAILVALGVLVLVMAVRPTNGGPTGAGPGESGGSSGPAGGAS